MTTCSPSFLETFDPKKLSANTVWEERTAPVARYQEVGEAFDRIVDDVFVSLAKDKRDADEVNRLDAGLRKLQAAVAESRPDFPFLTREIKDRVARNAGYNWYYPDQSYWTHKSWTVETHARAVSSLSNGVEMIHDAAERERPVKDQRTGLFGQGSVEKKIRAALEDSRANISRLTVQAQNVNREGNLVTFFA